jgi:hypothetical protein
VLGEGGLEGFETALYLRAEPIMEVAGAEQIVRELHGHKKREALRDGNLGADREAPQVGVDKVRELPDILGSLVATNGELLSRDFDLNGAHDRKISTLFELRHARSLVFGAERFDDIEDVSIDEPR